MSRPDRTIILDARAMSRALQRMAVEVLELSHGTDDLVLIGIQRRGVELAERIAKSIEQDEGAVVPRGARSEEHTSELQSRRDLVCRLLLEKKKKK